MINKNHDKMLKLLLEESSGEICSAFALAMKGYQTQVEIKILPKCRTFFVDSNKSKKRNFDEKED